MDSAVRLGALLKRTGALINARQPDIVDDVLGNASLVVDQLPDNEASELHAFLCGFFAASAAYGPAGHSRIFQALQAGASGYLLKRSDPDDILSAIREIKEGGAPMTSQIARKVVESFRKPAAVPRVEELSEREQEILELLAKGYVTKEIAGKLSVSVNTIRTHLQHIYDKLHVRSRTEAVIKYLDQTK